MSNENSKPPQPEATTLPGGGDEWTRRMETAVRGATELRRLGFEPGRVTVGDVSFELVIRARLSNAPASPIPAPPNPIEEMLGAEGAALLNRVSRRQADDEGDE